MGTKVPRALSTGLALLLAGVFLSAEAPAESIDRGQIRELAFQVDAGRLLDDIRWLAHDDRNGRLATTNDEDEVVAWIAERFGALGLLPFAAADLASYVHPFPIHTSFYPWDQDTGGSCTARGAIALSGTGSNVVAVLPGELYPTEFVIVGAHHDHLGPCGESIRNGADDNASGVAAMLEIAQILTDTETRPDKSVLFVAFGAEEIGQLGSKAITRLLVSNDLDRSCIVINMDMLGACAGAPFFVTLFGDDLNPATDLAMVVTEASHSLGHAVVSAGSRLQWSDHVSLAAYRIPAITITASAVIAPDAASDHDPSVRRSDDSGSPPVSLESMLRYHPGYHRPTDVVEALDVNMVVEMTRIALTAVLELATIRR